MLAHLGPPDMRVAISYALHCGESVELPIAPLDLAAVGALTFEPVDLDAFPCLRLAREAALAGGTAPCVLNAANEVAVHAFLEGRLPFNAIAETIERTLVAAARRAGARVRVAVRGRPRSARAVAGETVAAWVRGASSARARATSIGDVRAARRSMSVEAEYEPLSIARHARRTREIVPATFRRARRTSDHRWYDRGMTKAAKIAISLPPEQVEQARAAVARGEASSVSGYVSAALARGSSAASARGARTRSPHFVGGSDRRRRGAQRGGLRVGGRRLAMSEPD